MSASVHLSTQSLIWMSEIEISATPQPFDKNDQPEEEAVKENLPAEVVIAKEEEINELHHGDSENFVSDGTKEFIDQLYPSEDKKSLSRSKSEVTRSSSRKNNKERTPEEQQKWNEKLAETQEFYNRQEECRQKRNLYRPPVDIRAIQEENQRKAIEQQKRESMVLTDMQRSEKTSKKNSAKMAGNRYKQLVEVIIGNAKILPAKKFALLLRKFNIFESNDKDNAPKDDSSSKLSPSPTKHTTSPIKTSPKKETECMELEKKSLFQRVADYAVIKSNEEEEGQNEHEYDGQKLKELLCSAAGGSPVKGLAAAIRPTVTGSLSNMNPSLSCPYGSPTKSPNRSPNQSPKSKQSPSKKSPSKAKTTPQNSPKSTPNKKSEAGQNSPVLSLKKKNDKEDNDSDYDINEEPLPTKEKKTTPSKEPKPVRKSPNGAKYLPGFYDNIDFYAGQSPKKL